MLSLANKKGGIDVSKLNLMLKNGDYPGMFDYYSRFGVNGMQHEQMAAHYVNTISEFLKEFQSGLSQDIYNSLAWTGLKNTIAWKRLSSAEKQKINKTVQDFERSIGSENCNN